MVSAFIVGGGPRVGWGVARVFKKLGYKVAIGSRNPDVQLAEKEGVTPITLDLNETATVAKAFADVKSAIGTPNVVVYNAATLHANPKDPFAVSIEDFANDLNINAISYYAALKEAVAGFHILGSDVPRVFISTGNILHAKPMAIGTTLGVGKAIAAQLMHMGTIAYPGKGYQFYYVSQVNETGGPQFQPNGETHGKVYSELAQRKEQGPWDVRFTEDGKHFAY